MNFRNQIHGWQDFLELGVASWLIVSPFFLGFFSESNASLTVILIGCCAVTMSIFGMATEQPWEEWTNLYLGLFCVASPWLFGYAANATAVFNAVVVGCVLAALAILSMTHEYHELAHQTTNPPGNQ